MRTSQLVTALKNRFGDSLFTKDLLDACKGTIEALAEQDFGANGFDYEKCPYDAYQDADFADICSALDFTGYADLGPKACFADCFAQFAELIYKQFVQACFCLEKDAESDYALQGFIEAYESARDQFGCGAIYQLIRACDNIEAWSAKADLVSILGPKDYVVYYGLRFLTMDYAYKAERKLLKERLAKSRQAK